MKSMMNTWNNKNTNKETEISNNVINKIQEGERNNWEEIKETTHKLTDKISVIKINKEADNIKEIKTDLDNNNNKRVEEGISNNSLADNTNTMKMRALGSMWRTKLRSSMNQPRIKSTT